MTVITFIHLQSAFKATLISFDGYGEVASGEISVIKNQFKKSRI